ncbi:formyltetrahydrofolate deformylase [Mycolicibacterium sp. P9-64]|uniref:formyltetrahydrofolate deformylase n=1 Tax=Mycolicibacterium sp. P9-64 TaxID=2024612 RepID=UPI0011F07567|nr:formyltetrahydrofolate deformylase [Mycolicibacterium sp. P9-64]KAA0084567.1 formyltetrahydrofolate deformylase [Mycolicibacterium sp. P9-64]
MTTASARTDSTDGKAVAGTNFVLTLSCPDRGGIVQAIANALVETHCTISDSQQFGDPSTKAFFMRVAFSRETDPIELSTLEAAITSHVAGFDMNWQLYDSAERHRIILMVSKQGHCLSDLLFRVHSGLLPVHVAAVVSNHTDFEDLTNWYGIPFHHVPVTKETKPHAEDELRRLIKQYSADTVVLARYMQVLSNELCDDLAGRAINIHHSLLPSFKGARPYSQAYDRGVKVIGATAHYVTGDLDEGPIIEQDFIRVDHTRDPKELTAMGRDNEALALARALKWHAERRVLLFGNRTIVFN